MSTVTVTRILDAPAERIWRVMTDLTDRVTWLSTVDDVRVLTPGRFGPGTIWCESRTMPDGTRVTEEFHVDDCAAPHRFVVTSRGDGADYRMTYTLTPVDVGRRRGGTAVEIVQDGAPNGAGGRFLALVLGGLAARTVEGALRRDLADLALAVTRPARTDGDPAAAA
ncbi:SRPBCC family protein [Micromonospora sp. NPDC049679]|uniref:SRPBCC family protein n=1 Tax=Micromonospora sp. NPDC049679 TaxID=3155920 RepID=UPI0034050192